MPNRLSDATISKLDRVNLRPSAATFAAIGASRAERAGSISRNTWITEAVEEKLARGRQTDVGQDQGRFQHG